MTRISEIHGIPQNEYADRGAMVTPSGFFPYLSLTQGEAKVWLAAQRAKTLARWYGSDGPQYAQAAQMLDNALHAGLSNGINFVGAVPDYLQEVARLIQKASNETRPATRSGLYLKPNGSVHGVGQIIPVEERRNACRKAVDVKYPLFPPTPANQQINAAIKQQRQAAYVQCDRQFNIENIFNSAIENTGHHVIYHEIPSGVVLPARVDTKRIFHLGGVEGMAVAGDIDQALMKGWVENAILAKNAQIGVGAWGSVRASVELSPNPEQYFKQFTGQSLTSPGGDKWRPGAMNGIGDPVTVGLIIGAIATALAAAKDLINALRKQQATIAAQSFGTSAYSADTDDYLGAGTPSNPDVTTAGSLDTTTLLLLAAGAGLLLWASDSEN